MIRSHCSVTPAGLSCSPQVLNGPDCLYRCGQRSFLTESCQLDLHIVHVPHELQFLNAINHHQWVIVWHMHFTETPVTPQIMCQTGHNSHSQDQPSSYDCIFVNVCESQPAVGSSGLNARWPGDGLLSFKFSLILDSSVGLSADIEPAGDSVLKTLVRILHSPEEDNLPPFDSKSPRKAGECLIWSSNVARSK